MTLLLFAAMLSIALIWPWWAVAARPSAETLKPDQGVPVPAVVTPFDV